MRLHCSWKTAFEGPNIVLFLHNVTSVRSMLLPSQLAETLKGFTSSPSSENHHCTNSPCSLKAFLSLKQRQWRGTFQMSWRQSYRIATSMLFPDSTGFDSLPSLPYRAHQIASGKLSFVSHLMIRSPIHHPPPVWVLAPLRFKCTMAYSWSDSYHGEVFYWWLCEHNKNWHRYGNPQTIDTCTTFWYSEPADRMC